MIGANTCHRWVPAYVEEVQKCFKEGHTEALHQSNNEADRQKRNYDKFTSTEQLMMEMWFGQKLMHFTEKGRWKISGTK